MLSLSLQTDMAEVQKASSSSTGSVQSTPTPPSSGQSGRSRRSARKCATPIKSAEKVDKEERVSLHQLSLTDTSSTNTTITPESSNLTKPQIKLKVSGEGILEVVHVRVPLRFETKSISGDLRLKFYEGKHPPYLPALLCVA